MIKKYIKCVIVFVVIVLTGIMYSCEREQNVIKVRESETVPITESDTLDDILETTKEVICVHVTGYVVNAGVYTLPKGSRVYEAIQVAGGFLPEADTEYINLAEVINDGAKIRVLSKEEAQTAGLQDVNTNVGQGSKININTASKDSLMTLPGIGESRAESIIAYREKNGGFNTIEDIMKISGIKEAAFDKIKDYICIK